MVTRMQAGHGTGPVSAAMLPPVSRKRTLGTVASVA
jgi:hypothetical protein